MVKIFFIGIGVVCMLLFTTLMLPAKTYAVDCGSMRCAVEQGCIANLPPDCNGMCLYNDPHCPTYNVTQTIPCDFFPFYCSGITCGGTAHQISSCPSPRYANGSIDSNSNISTTMDIVPTPTGHISSGSDPHPYPSTSHAHWYVQTHDYSGSFYRVNVTNITGYTVSYSICYNNNQHCSSGNSNSVDVHIDWMLNGNFERGSATINWTYTGGPTPTAAPTTTPTQHLVTGRVISVEGNRPGTGVGSCPLNADGTTSFPAINHTVTLSDIHSNQRFIATTDSGGAFYFNNVPTSEYELCWQSANPYQFYCNPYGVSLNNCELVDVTTDVRNRRFVVKRDFQIPGQVVDAGLNPPSCPTNPEIYPGVNNQQMTLTGPNIPNPVITTYQINNVDGAFTFDGLQNGTYTLCIGPITPPGHFYCSPQGPNCQSIVISNNNGTKRSFVLDQLTPTYIPITNTPTPTQPPPTSTPAPTLPPQCGGSCPSGITSCPIVCPCDTKTNVCTALPTATPTPTATPLPSPSPTAIPTPTTASWIQLKGSSFQSQATLQDIIPKSPKDFDGNVGQPYFVVGNVLPYVDPGAVNANGINLGRTNADPKVSVKLWSNASHGRASLNIRDFMQYAKANKEVSVISSLNDIRVNKINILSTNNTITVHENDIVDRFADDVNGKVVLIIYGGNVLFDTSSGVFNGGNQKKSIAILVTKDDLNIGGGITFSNTMTEANGIFISDHVDLGATVDKGLKIEGNIITNTMANGRKWSDNTKPSVYITSSMSMYVQLLPLLSKSTLEWKQLK